MADATRLPVGEIVELAETGKPDGKSTRFEVISMDPRTGLLEAKACEANADGEFTHIRMRLARLH
jgi:hypothetical protein